MKQEIDLVVLRFRKHNVISIICLCDRHTLSRQTKQLPQMLIHLSFIIFLSSLSNCKISFSKKENTETNKQTNPQIHSEAIGRQNINTEINDISS